MTRVFLDASVIFSACYSTTGHSHDLILMAIRGDYQLIGSELVFEEARRNLAGYAKEYIVFLDYVIESLQPELVRPSKAEVLGAAKHVALKDAPIVAAAMKAKADILVTLDKKHLLGKPELAKFARTKILTPQEAVQTLKAN